MFAEIKIKTRYRLAWLQISDTTKQNHAWVYDQGDVMQLINDNTTITYTFYQKDIYLAKLSKLTRLNRNADNGVEAIA